MRNKFRLLVLLLVMLALVFTACTNGSDTEEATDEPVDMEETTDEEEVAEEPAGNPYDGVTPATDIVFWHQHSGEREEALQQIIADFNATNEWGITVTAEYQGGYGDIFNKMLPILNTLDVPDIVVAYQNQAATYQVADALTDLNPLVDSEAWGLSAEEIADFFPGFYSQDVFPNFDNQRLGFPPNRSMEVMYYNMDWLTELGYDAAPATPEEFKEMACAAAATPFSGATAEGSMGYKLSIDASRFASWTFAFGGDVFDYENGVYTYDSDAAVEAWSFLQDLFNEGCAELVTESYGDQTDFGNGTLLFTVGSSSGLPYYASAVDEGAAFEWSVGAIPHTTDEPVMNIYGASVSVPKSTAERQLAAWLFIKYYTSTDVQAIWAKASNYFPVRQSVAEGLTDYFEANPMYKTAFDMLEYGVGEPPVPGYDFARDIAEEGMAAIADGADVVETLTNVTAESNVILEEQLSSLPEIEPTAEPEPEVEAGPYDDVTPATEIVFWHQHSGEREEALQEIIADFNATNEWGITVTAEYQGGYGDIFNKMLPILNTPDVPDVVVAYQNQTATYQLADAIADLNPLVDSSVWGLSEEEIADFFPGFWKQDVFPNFDNQRLGFPPNRSMEVVYYNMDWLTELGYDAAPTTPEEFKEMACAAAATPFSGATAEGSMGYKLSIDASRFASWTFAFGGDVFDYENGVYTYDSDAAVEAWTFMQELFTEGCAELVTESYGDQTDFGNGTLLFTVGSSSGLPYYASAVNEGAAFEWSVAAIPHTTDAPVQNIYGASVSVPKSTPERELAAWLFIKYYTSTEAQAEWAKASQYFPVRQSVANELADYFEANPAYQTAFDMLEYGVGEPPVPGYDFARDIAEEAMAAIADGADVIDTLTQLNVDANDILDEQMAQIQ